MFQLEKEKGAWLTKEAKQAFLILKMEAGIKILILRAFKYDFPEKISKATWFFFQKNLLNQKFFIKRTFQTTWRIFTQKTMKKQEKLMIIRQVSNLRFSVFELTRKLIHHPAKNTNSRKKLRKFSLLRMNKNEWMA